MLSKKSDSIIRILSETGLSNEEITVYLHLCEYGFVTALELSKKLPISRTKIYRILDDLYEKSIINHELTERGLRFGVTSAEHLSQMVDKRMQKLVDLQNRIPEVISYLQSIGIDPTYSAKVRLYKGKKGLEQVTYNSTKSLTPIRIYEARPTMETFLDHDVAEDMRTRMKTAGIRTLQLTNEKEIPSFSEVFDDITEYWEVRYVDPKLLKFEFEVLVYDSTYCIYNVEGEDIYCVEIEDERLARMQIQLFDYIWGTAQSMHILSKNGHAVLR